MEVKRILTTLNVINIYTTRYFRIIGDYVIIKHEANNDTQSFALIAAIKVSNNSISIPFSRLLTRGKDFRAITAYRETTVYLIPLCHVRNLSIRQFTFCKARHRETRPRRGIDRSIQIDIYTLANRTIWPIDCSYKKAEIFRNPVWCYTDTRLEASKQQALFFRKHKTDILICLKKKL